MNRNSHALHRIHSASKARRRLVLHLIAVGVVLLALVPIAQPVRADTSMECILTASSPTGQSQAVCPNYSPPALLNLNQPLYTATITQTTSLGVFEGLAVTNIIKARGLAATDANAVLSWGRADAQAELYDLLLRAIATDSVSRTVDQQNVVDWVSAVAQRKAVQAAQAAGLEYVKWAGLSQLTYQSLLTSKASQSDLQTFLCGGDCTAGKATVNPAGFCTYRPPAPYSTEYDDHTDPMCYSSNGLVNGCIASCLPPTPEYDQFVKWGEADANYALLNSGGYTTAATSIAIGLGIALPLAAYNLATIPYAVIAAAVRSAASLDALSAKALVDAAGAGTFGRSAAQLANAAVTAAKAAKAAQAAVNSIRVFAVIGGALLVVELLGNLASAILQGIAVANAAALPGQLATLIVNAETTAPDLTALESGSAGGATLFDLFVGATLPTPRNDTCDNALIPPALYGSGETWISPAGALINTVPCLNAPTIPPASASDPQFVVQAKGGTISSTTPTITWADKAAGTTTTARLSTNWFVEQVNGAAAQTQALHITYTDWSGTEQTSWLVGDPTDGYAFLTVASASTTVDPATCVANGLCSYGTAIDYLGSDGNDYQASVQAPGANGQIPGQLAPGTLSGDNPTGTPLVSTHTCPAAVEGCPVEFFANTFGPLDAFNNLGQIVSPMTYTWEFAQPPCYTCLQTAGAGPDYTAPIPSNGTTDYTFERSGTYAVRLTATDANGKQAVDTFSIAIGDAPPALSLDPSCPQANPCDTRTAQEGTAVSLGGTIAHTGAQDVENVSVTWGDGSVDSAYCGVASPFNAPPNSGCGPGVARPAAGIALCCGSLTLNPDATQTHIALSDTHSYARAGRYYVTVVVTDQSGATDSQTFVETVTNPAPTTSGLALTPATTDGCIVASLPSVVPPAPAAAAIGSSPIVTVTGSGFVPDSLVQWDGAPLATTYVSPCQLTARVPATDTASATVGALTVVNAAPGGGASNPQVLYITPQGTLAGSALAASVNGSAAAVVGGHSNLIGGVGLPGTPGTLSATASGAGTLGLAQYNADPVSTSPPAAVNAYFDVFVPAGGSFGSVQVTDCNLGGGSVVYYYDGTTTRWTPVSGQTYDASSGCVSVTLSAFSAPSLIQLSGTVFGVGNAPPRVTNPGPQSVLYGGPVSLPISAADQEAADKLTLRASGLPAGLSFTDNGDGTGTVSGTLTADVGVYTATVSANDGYSDSAPVTVTFTVKLAPLTITANNKSMTYGGGVPTFTASDAGLVNGDTPSVVTGLACGATDGSGHAVGSATPAGTYAIACGGASAANYSITYRAGTLTINPAPLTITADNQRTVYGQTLPPFTVTPSGLVNGDTLASLQGTLTVTTTATRASAPGAYALSPGGLSSPNYGITYQPGTLTIGQDASVVTLASSANPVPFGRAVTLTATVGAASPGSGTPTGTVTFLDGETPIGTAALVNGRAGLTIATLLGGAHSLGVSYGGDPNFTAGRSAALAQAIAFSRTVGGAVGGPLTVRAGEAVLITGTVNGALSVQAGGAVELAGAHVSGPLSANGTAAVALCGSTVSGPVSISGSAGFVRIGAGADDPAVSCAGDTLQGSLTLSGNKGGVEVEGATVSGPLSLTNTSGGATGEDSAAPELEGNTIGGSLSCSGNTPLPTADGHPNTVSGPKSGQCAGL